MSYLLIFISKTIENILSTLRIIFISNHKKLLGALLSFIITLTWIFSTVYIIKNFNRNPAYIIIYALGCFIGSYLGSTLEETLALGENMLTIITNSYLTIYNKLNELGYNTTLIDGYNTNKKVILILIPRRKKYKVYSLIKLIDSKATIICENVYTMKK